MVGIKIMEKIMIKYYTDTNGNIYANPTKLDGLAEVEEPIYNGEILPKHKALTYEEGTIVAPHSIVDMLAEKATVEAEAKTQAEFRAERDKEIDWVDIEINKAEDLGQDTVSFRAYRQELRDAPLTWVMPTK